MELDSTPLPSFWDTFSPLGGETERGTRGWGMGVNHKMRLLYEENIEDIALGAAVLGTGGGGDPYVGKLMAREAIRQYGPVELYTLDELDDDDLIVPAAGMGAPIVIVEKLPGRP